MTNAVYAFEGESAGISDDYAQNAFMNFEIDAILFARADRSGMVNYAKLAVPGTFDGHPEVGGLTEPAIHDADNIVYNQYTYGWRKTQTCETLLAASRRGAGLLLIGDRLSDIDSSFVGDQSPLRACIDTLTHLSRRGSSSVKTSNVGFISGSPFVTPTGSWPHPATEKLVVPYEGSRIPTGVLDPQKDVVFGRTEAGPVGVAFSGDGRGRTVVLGAVSREQAGSTFDALTAVIEGSYDTLLGCAPFPLPTQGKSLATEAAARAAGRATARPIIHRNGAYQGSLAYLHGVRSWLRLGDSYHGLDETNRIVFSSRGPVSFTGTPSWEDASGTLVKLPIARSLQGSLRSDLTLSSRFLHGPESATIASDW